MPRDINYGETTSHSPVAPAPLPINAEDQPLNNETPAEPPAQDWPPGKAALVSGFPIVGIGASAGGLAAFEAFFRSIPTDLDCRLAFVVVQHLSPDHKSELVELLRSYTELQVLEIEDGMRVQPGCVYVIPSNHELAIFEGRLQLLQMTEPRSQRLPIDFFFNALAQDQHQWAIGLIFSGSGHDGSQGVRAIKAAGGMVMVQSPDTAEFASMPQAAIETGVVDNVLPICEMPRQLLAYAAQAFKQGPLSTKTRTNAADNAIQKIFMLIRARTGHDFASYKPSTIERRIERRMAVNQVESLDDYVAKLQQTPTEIDALFQDLLIGVTNFFRDADAFEKLNQLVLPRLISEKISAGSPLRAWVCGCSTGEEAYSVAMLIHEQLEATRPSTETSIPVQIFASDIDARAIASARAGLYRANIAESVSPQRLARYFSFEAEHSAYRIHKKIRDLVIFSEHDVNKDPPFSKIDLISCRNLMIYLSSELQHKLIPLFHFALNTNGFLFLGSSEGIGDFEQLFSIVDRGAKLFRRQPDFEGMPRAKWQRTSTSWPSESLTQTQAHMVPATPVRKSLKTVAEQAVLNLISPTAALIDVKGNILYLLGRTGNFLEPAAGEPTAHNIFRMAREGLRQPLTRTLHKVVVTQKVETLLNVPVRSNGHFTEFSLTISPVSSLEENGADDNEQMYLVLLVETDAAPHSVLQPQLNVDETLSLPSDHSVARDSEELIASLSSQLQAKEEYLQSAYEELETANEELKSSNEEMQSVNEELQSTNEELETSKEELQSINEELATVNTELQNKVTDLSRLNNDMNNLLSGSGIATIFVDTKLHILRFTPSMSQIINLIHSDVGRPVGHVVSNLVDYDRLVSDVQAVLETLESQERRVQTSGGSWFQMRIKPYRTIENVIEGVVITFVDVTQMKQAEDNLEKANRQLRLAVVVRDASDAITMHDLEGRILAWNPSAARIYGWSEEEALAMNIRQRVPVPLQRECMAQVARLSQAEILEPFPTQRLTKSGQVVRVYITATALLNEAGVVYAISTNERLEAAL